MHTNDILKTAQRPGIIRAFFVQLFLFIVVFAVIPPLLLPLFCPEGMCSPLSSGVIEILYRSGLLILMLLLSNSEQKRLHGAEHMAIHCLNRKLPLTPEHSLRCPRIHVGCGTTTLSFMLILYSAVSLILHATSLSVIQIIALEILLFLPLVSLAFESARILKHIPVHASAYVFAAPLSLLQYLSTAPPKERELIAALASLHALGYDEEDTTDIEHIHFSDVQQVYARFFDKEPS